MKKNFLIASLFGVLAISCESNNHDDKHTTQEKADLIENENYTLYKQRFLVLKKIDSNEQEELVLWLVKSMNSFIEIPDEKLTDNQKNLKIEVQNYLTKRLSE